VSLNARNNSFGGTILSSLCAICHAAAVLDVSVSLFGKGVSPGFGNCSRLPLLSAGRNNLASKLRDDLFAVNMLLQLLLPLKEIHGGSIVCRSPG
jgi:hypothetical protein